MYRDYHVHSTYSDGSFLRWMVGTAESLGLDAVGVADHCNVSERSVMVDRKHEMGFNLDLTYERRRAAIDQVREEHDITVYDAVEMDYEPVDEETIRAFLADADFEYAIGSVHYLEDVNVHYEDYFAAKPRDERAALVERYFEKLVALIESELFAIAAHIDLVERNPALRGLATEEQYERVASAFTGSRTVPEVNAGRVLRDYGEFHPAPRFREILHEYDVPFVVGSDAHRPDDLRERTVVLQEELADTGAEPIELSL